MFIPSLELGRVHELEEHKASRRHKTQGWRKVESSTLKERGKRSISSQMQK